MQLEGDRVFLICVSIVCVTQSVVCVLRKKGEFKVSEATTKCRLYVCPAAIQSISAAVDKPTLAWLETDSDDVQLQSGLLESYRIL